MLLKIKKGTAVSVMNYGFPDIIASVTKEKEHIVSSNRILNIPVDVSKSDSNDLEKKQTKENFMKRRSAKLIIQIQVEKDLQLSKY